MNKPNKTFIKWISTRESLPEIGMDVLTLNDKNDIIIQRWSPEDGWQSRCFGLIKFWSTYNLPR